MPLNEFQLISKHFTRRAKPRSDVIAGIGDDCALLKPKANEVLAISIDTLVENVHFPADTPAENIGYKALAVSLSDLAAMGADPQWATLALTLPRADEDWLSRFTTGFFELANEFGVQLVGGDMTKGPLSITTQLHGSVPESQVLRRSGAKIDDRLFVTGTIGAAGLGLLIKQQKLRLPAALHSAEKKLIAKLERPQPRIATGQALRATATSAIDVSDGLAADICKILTASSVGAELYVEKLPVPEVFDLLKDQVNSWQHPLSVGDDYELCFTAPVHQREALQSLAKYTKIPIIEIGKIVAGQSLRCLLDGDAYPIDQQGYDHFRVE